MRGSGIGLLALALVSVCACGRKNEQQPEQVGETTTTSGPSEAQRTKEEAQNLPPAVPIAPSAEEKAKEEQAKKAEEAKKAEHAKKAHKTNAAVHRKLTTKKIPKGEEPTSVTTITTVEIETGPRRPQPQEPSKYPATPPGGAPLPSIEAGQHGQYVNQSTVFGNGQSGTYTDNQGTYGGRATWGTGKGAPGNAR
jgi:hypothetical protein